MAETRTQAERAFDDWIERYEDKYPKATACLARDREQQLAFYDFPAAHWTHLRTTNVIEGAKFHEGIEVTEDSRAVA